MLPDEIKCVKVVPVYKKRKKDKNNYRPLSILSNMSKLYKRCMQQQINEYFQSLLPKFQCGYGKRFSAQHCFLVTAEKIKKRMETTKKFLLLFSLTSLKLLTVYLTVY